MKKKAIIFMDYNETFDDIGDGKGYILFNELQKTFKYFDDNIDIIIITSALHNSPMFSIKNDLLATLIHFPKKIQKSFKGLIEEDCKVFTEINNLCYGKTRILNEHGTSKKQGVETYLQLYDKKKEIESCIFVGDSEDADLVMLDAKIEERKKFMILANKRVLKYKRHPVLKLSMNTEENYKNLKNFMLDINKNNQQKDLLIKSSNHSYGAGKGFEALNLIFEEQSKNK